MARDVFISYHSADSAAADRIRALLEGNGIRCWIATKDLGPGNTWPEEIQEGIRRSHVLLLVLSSNSKHSKQIAREVALADSSGLRIVPFYLENVAPPPDLEFFITNVQRIDGYGSKFEPGVRSLVEFVRQSPKFPAKETVPWVVKERLAEHQTRPFSNHRQDEPRSNQDGGNAEALIQTRRKYLLTGGLLLAIIATCVTYYWLGQARKKQEIDTAFKNGIEALNRKDDAGAIGSFSRVLDLQPASAAAFEHRAQAYHHQDRDNLALADVDRAMNLPGADSTGLHLLRGEVLKGLRRYDEALLEYNAVLAAPPADKHALRTAQHARDDLMREIELRSFTGGWLTQFDNGAFPKKLAERTKQFGLLQRRTFHRCKQTLEGKATCYYDSVFEKVPSATEDILLKKNVIGNWELDGYGFHHKLPQNRNDSE